jgi:hypothetical protein
MAGKEALFEKLGKLLGGELSEEKTDLDVGFFNCFRWAFFLCRTFGLRLKLFKSIEMEPERELVGRVFGGCLTVGLTVGLKWGVW